MHFILNLTTQAAYSSAGTTSIPSRLRRSQRLASMEGAMEHFRHQYRISTAEQEAIVWDHLGRVSQGGERGLCPPGVVDQGQDLAGNGVGRGSVGRKMKGWRLNGERCREHPLPLMLLKRDYEKQF